MAYITFECWDSLGIGWGKGVKVNSSRNPGMTCIIPRRLAGVLVN